MTLQFGRLNKEREIELMELAEFIADFHCPNTKTNPKRIAQAKGITYSFDHYGGSFDGLLQCTDGKFHIHLNRDSLVDEEYPRSRFTFCHELGHYFIDDHRSALLEGKNLFHPSFAEYQSDLRVEREADHFACSLLMPKTRFRNSYSIWKSSEGLALVEKLQKQFGVSLTSAAIRLVKENLFPSGVIKWSPKKVLQWYWFSDDLYEKVRGAGKSVATVNQVDLKSATYRATNQTHNNEEKIYQHKIPLSAFLPFISSRGNGDVMVKEHAMKLGEYGTLTFLFK